MDDGRPDTRSWTVREAKAKLSEVLRRASEEGPQQIGARGEYVVMTRAEYEALRAPRKPFGQALLDNFRGLGPIELPSRKDNPDRPVPFADDA